MLHSNLGQENSNHYLKIELLANSLWHWGHMKELVCCSGILPSCWKAAWLCSASPGVADADVAVDRVVLSVSRDDSLENWLDELEYPVSTG
jgi:hypothetical protein